MGKDRDRDERARSEEVAKTCLNFNVRRGTRAITQLYDQVGRVSGLRSTQFGLLTAIRLAAPINLKSLGQLLSMDPTTLTRNLAPLETRDLVSVEPGEDDRRERIIRITRHGQATLDRAYPHWQKAQARAVAELGTARVDRLLGDLSVAARIRRDQ